MVMPFLDRCGILQFPIFLEDGGYLKYHGVPKIEQIVSKFQENGIYVFNFHPIHLAMNSCDFFAIRQLKDSLTSEEYGKITYTDIKRYRNNRYGMANFLTELLTYAYKNNIKCMNLRQCYEEKDKIICF